MTNRVESTETNNMIQSDGYHHNKSEISVAQDVSSPTSYLAPPLPSKSFLGVTLKPGVPVTAFINYLLAFFLSVQIMTLFSTSGYFLIRSPDYYNVVDDFATQDYLTNITFYNEIYSIVMLPITGLFHDYFGRRIMFVTGTLICAIALFIIPTLGIIYPWLLLARMLLQQGIIHLLTNPLAADYVVDEKKGLASAYAGIAAGLGAILAALGLMGMGRKVGWGSVFYLSGGLSLVIGFYMFLFVVNVKYQQDQGRCPLIPSEQQLNGGSGNSAHVPSTMSNRISKSIQSSGEKKGKCWEIVWNKIKTAAKQSCNSIIITSYIGSFAIRACDILMTVFLISYVSSTIYDPDQAERVTHTMSGLGSVVGLGFAVLFGFLSDKIGFALTNIISYICAGLCYALVTYVNNDDVKNRTTSALMILGAGFVTAGIVVNNMMINRVLRKDVKGLIMGMFVFFGSCGVLFETKVGNKLYDMGYYGGPFPLGAGLCFFTALVTLVFWAGGCFQKDINRAKKELEL